jgi:hypothetical protein
MPESKTDLKVYEDEEGDIDEVLDEEADKIKEDQNQQRKDLLEHFQQYKIKVII